MVETPEILEAAATVAETSETPETPAPLTFQQRLLRTQERMQGQKSRKAMPDSRLQQILPEPPTAE